MASFSEDINVVKLNRKSYSATEKLLLLIAVFAFILCVIFLACLSMMVVNYKSCPRNSTEKFSKKLSRINGTSINRSCNEVCSSTICRNQASFLSKNIDESIDPCDDFYQFACGNFLKNSVIPEDENKIDLLSITQKEIMTELMNEIKEKIKPNEPEAFKKTKTFYENCMTSSRDEGKNILLESLEQAGGWPALHGDNWRESDFDWLDAVYKINDYGYPVTFPVTISIDIDPRNTTKNIISLIDAVTRIKQIYLSDGRYGKSMQAYNDYMIDVAMMMGADKDTAARETRLALDFEFDLYNIQASAQQQQESTTSSEMTIAELSMRHPNIPWLQLINKVLYRSTKLKIDKDEPVLITDPDFLARFDELLDRTSKRAIANYLMWQVVYDAIDYLSDEFLDRKLIFTKITSGVERRKNREELCAYDVIQGFPIAVGAMYVRKYFHVDTKDAVLELISNVKNQFRKMLEEVDWMDNETKKVALEKIDAMNVLVGCADELFDDQKIDEYYRRLEIHRGSYLKSAFNVSLFFSGRLYGTLRQPVDKKDWSMRDNAAIINAYYYTYTNTFEIPAGFLRGFFYHYARPQYMNYGAIGSIIGHEITHGFDSDGRKSDKNGNEVDWWKTSTRSMFAKKAKCIIDQYNEYTVKEIDAKVRGGRTHNENIADNGGLRAAYRAYVEWTRKKNATEPCLPNLSYSPKQLFWISAANNWCRKQKPEMLRETVNRDQHSPPEARVILPLSNIKEFSDDFDCKPGSRMNPEKKCIVW